MRSRLHGLLAPLFPAEDDGWLTILRVGLGLQVTAYTLSARADWHELYSSSGQGLINRELSEAFLDVQSPLAPRLGWLVSIGKHVCLSEQAVLWLSWACLLGAGILTVLGCFSRLSAVVAWFLHLSAVKSEQFLSYGMDNFTTIGLFYLMLSPLPDKYSFDGILRGKASKRGSLLGFYRRILQIHLCFIYFFSGIAKCTGAEWWNGTAMWQIFTSPPFNLVSPNVVASSAYLLPLLGIGICLLEIGYPVFIWPKITRKIWLSCIVGMHLIVALTMGLYLFSFIMIVLNSAGFAPIPDSAKVKDIFGRAFS